MDIRSMYAIELGKVIATCYPPGVGEKLDDFQFKVVVEDDEYKDEFFDNVTEAIDAAMALASDPRDFVVYVGLDVASQDAQYIEIKHMAVARG